MGKKYKAGITEKRLQNRRFRRTEEAILRVFFQEDIYIGTKEMAAKAGVARSTFYHHHKTVRGILPDYEKYILRKYVSLIDKMVKKENVKLRVVFQKTLIFILQNKMVFEFLMQDGDMRVTREMLKRIQPKITKHMRIKCSSEKIFMVYVGEMVALVREWSEGGFDGGEIEQILDNMMYLTETAKVRLSPVA